MTLPHPLQTVLKGLRNGLEYGSKIRLVHSIVMTLLFRNWSRKEFKAIFEMAV